MNKIVNLKVLEDYKIELEFQTGENKIFDFKPLLDKEVFQELKNARYFSLVKNRGYFIEWPHEQDLSVDTLYYDGQLINKKAN